MMDAMAPPCGHVDGSQQQESVQHLLPVVHTSNTPLNQFHQPGSDVHASKQEDWHVLGKGACTRLSLMPALLPGDSPVLLLRGVLVAVYVTT